MPLPGLVLRVVRLGADVIWWGLRVLLWLLSLVLGVSLILGTWMHMLMVAVGREAWEPGDWWLLPACLVGGVGLLWLFGRIHEEGP